METLENDSIRMTSDSVTTACFGHDAFPFPCVSGDTLPEIQSASPYEQNDPLLWLFPSNRQLKEYATSKPYKPQDPLASVPSKEGVPLRETIQQTVWFTPLMLFLVTCYCLILSRHSKTLFQEVKEFFYPKSRNDMFNSSVTEVSRLRLMLGGLSILCVSVYCYFVLVGFFSIGQDGPLWTLGKILLLAVGYLFVKIFSVMLLNYTFFYGEVAGLLSRSYSTLTTWLGIGLLVPVLFAAYARQSVAEIAWMAGMVVCCCSVVLYVYKILTIFFTGFTSLFYLILYLCTLEILPSVALIIGLVSIV